MCASKYFLRCVRFSLWWAVKVRSTSSDYHEHFNPPGANSQSSSRSGNTWVASKKWRDRQVKKTHAAPFEPKCSQRVMENLYVVASAWWAPNRTFSVRWYWRSWLCCTSSSTPHVWTRPQVYPWLFMCTSWYFLRRVQFSLESVVNIETLTEALFNSHGIAGPIHGFGHTSAIDNLSYL